MDLILNVLMMDMKFGNNSDNIVSTEVNTTSARENVGEIERRMHVVKEKEL